jgi:tail tube protein
MPIGSGIGSSFGMVPEVTYGTYVAPTRWVEGAASLRKTKQVYQGGGMAAGRLMQPGTRRVITTKGAGGNFACSVSSVRMGHLFNGLMGGTVTPVQQGATPAYLQTHALGDPFGKFYTMQSGIPDLGGTVRPYTFLGCQVDMCEFSCDLGGPLTAAFTMACRDVTEGQTLAAPSYPTANEFHWAQAALKLGTFGAEAQVDGVRKVAVKIERRKHDGGPYMGNAGLRSQGVINDWAKITGTLEADYLTKADFADRFASDASTSMVWEFIGPLISGSNFETFRLTLPQVFFDTDTPTAESPDVVRTSYNFTAQFDGTNQPTIAYMSTDTTL